MKTSPRQKLVRLIHVAKRDLRMNDDTYRDILFKVGKKKSSADMTIPELEHTLEHMKKCGFKVRHKNKTAGQRKPATPCSRTLADFPEARKIRALWLFLHQLGLVKNPNEAALGAYCKRITGVDALQWMDGDQVLTMIETLKKWAMRVLPGKVHELAHEVAGAVRTGKIPLSPEELADLNAVYAKARQFPSFDPMWTAYEHLSVIAERAH
ncbi:MAG: DUF1018 domain-containing protein [Burkholderiaceae bacterium]|jgi:phage gp16-like protein|nr:DUF1018 domain-containing protein [Burkholderiaceae bacterium]